MELNCCHRPKVDSKAFASILTAKAGAVRIEIANALESTFAL